MEFKPTADEGEEVSSSQDTICLLKPSKRETESMEDFVDLTKDISSVKDITTQFLQSETNERNQNQSYDSLMSFGENDVKLNDREQVFFDLTSNATDSIVDSNELTSALDAFSYGDRDDVKAYFDGNSGKKIHQDEYNNFMNFEQDEGIYTTNSNDSGEPFIHNENMKGNLVTDISDYTADDVHTHYDIPNAPQDLFFTKNKGENMPVSHQTDFENDNAQSWQVPESKSDKTKESALNPPASQLPKPREEETTRLHGEGINTRETDDGDMSDGDDIVPEPIPKDYPEIGAFTGKELLAAVGIDTWFHPELLHPKIESLVYWRDPKKSGVVFGSVMVILLSLTTFSLISVVAYTSLAILGGALGFRIYKNVLQAVQKTAEGHPFKTYLLPVLNHRAVSAVFMSIKEFLEFDLTLSPERAREICDVVVSHLNSAVAKCRSLFLVEDIVDSVKFGFCLWCLTYVGSWFNGLSLLIISFVGLFTLPKVYENNKAVIDANLDVVRSKINEVTDKIRAVSPIGKKADDAKDKSE